jgi:hypothetical protein
VAQSSSDETRMRTVDDCVLFCNDTSVHVLKFQLNWPDKLGDADLTPLQQYLTLFFFGTEANEFVPALNTYTSSLGAPTDSMPDMEDEHRYYQDCKLKVFWYLPHQFLSLYAYKQERNGEGRVLSTKRRYFTYDLVNGRVLTQKDIFNQSRVWGTYDDDYRIVFEELVEHFAQVGEHDYIDMSKLPRDVALYKESILFDLGESETQPGRDNLSVVPAEHLSFLFTKEIKKRLKSKVKD